MPVKRRRMTAVSAAAARRSGGNRSHRSDPTVIRMTICIALFAAVLLIKALGGGPLAEARETLGRLIGDGADYREAVSALGKAVAEKRSLAQVMEDEAVKVFGESLLHPGTKDEGEVSEADAEADVSEDGEGVQPVSGEAEDTETGTPDDAEVPEPANDTPEEAAEAMSEDTAGLLETEDENTRFLRKTGSDPLFSSVYGETEPSVVDDSYLDVVPVSVVDDTPAEAFKIPSPDIVDETVYSLPFKFANPVKGHITSPFGYRIHPITKKNSFHYGVDLSASLGETVKSFAAGTVVETGTGSVYGKYIKVDHGAGFFTRYCHLSKISVKKGEKVKLGEKIGEAGSTGMSTGVHLHFEVRTADHILDPTGYLRFK